MNSLDRLNDVLCKCQNLAPNVSSSQDNSTSSSAVWQEKLSDCEVTCESDERSRAYYSQTGKLTLKFIY